MSPIALLTVILFAIVGGYFSIRLLVDRGGYDRVFNLSHVLMSLMMIMMAGGWSMRIPASLQITVFTAFALWYVYLAMFRPTAVKNLTSPPGDRHHSGRPRLIYHAAMMLAMVWMAVVMAPLPPAGAGEPSMDMEMPDHVGHGSGATSMPLHPWADPVSIVIGIAFGLCTLWYLIRFIRRAGAPRGRASADAHRLTDLAASAAMAAGMALAFLWEMT